MPEFFLITVLTSKGRILRKLRKPHQRGYPVENYLISEPKSVDVCALRVRISAGNSAGMSGPSEAIEVGKSQYILLKNLDYSRV